MEHYLFIAIGISGQYEMHQAGNYLFKVNKRNTRARCEIRLMLAIKTPE